MTNGKTNSIKRIPTLDGWRALAIILVVVHHAGTAFYSELEYYRISPTRFGTWGVPVFFALSGLLITKLLLNEFSSTGAISLTSFYIRRVFRILPPAFAYIGLIAAIGLITSRAELLSSLLFFRNYVPDSITGLYTTHLWSLAVEEHFYLIWPGLLVLLGLRRGLAAAVVLTAVVAVWRSADFHWHLFARSFPGITSGTRTDLRLDCLFCGCIVAFLLHKDATCDWLRQRCTLGVWWALAVAFPLCLIYQPYLTPLWLNLLIPLLMVGTVLHPAWRISQFLDLEPIKWIGRISYSLYLWQQMFLIPSWEPRALGILQVWPVNICAALAAACISYYCIEKPAIRLGHTFPSRFGSQRLVATSREPDPTSDVLAVGSPAAMNE